MSAVSATSRRGRASVRLRARPGFTLVELIAAMLILTVGMLSLATTTVYVSRQMSHASLQTVAAQVAQSRLDSLSSVRCDLLAVTGPTTGSGTFRGVTESWTVTDGNDVKFITTRLTYRGLTNPLAYKSVIPCRD